jgi:hypothetical protein
MATIDSTSIRYYAGIVGVGGIDSAMIGNFIANNISSVSSAIGKTSNIDSAACTDAEKSVIEKYCASDCLMTGLAGNDEAHIARARMLRMQAIQEQNDLPAEWNYEILDVTT